MSSDRYSRRLKWMLNRMDAVTDDLSPEERLAAKEALMMLVTTAAPEVVRRALNLGSEIACKQAPEDYPCCVRCAVGLQKSKARGAICTTCSKFEVEQARAEAIRNAEETD